MSNKRKSIKRPTPLLPSVMQPVDDTPKTEQEASILIGTPAYGSMVHTDYLHTIIDMLKIGFHITTFTIGNESLITRGRNTIISYFHEHSEFTHLLYLDADIGIEAKSIMKLLTYQKDVIGAPVPLKGTHPTTGEKVYNIGDVLSTSPDNSTLISTNRLGTAVLMLSRTAVAALIEGADVYSSSEITRGVKLNQPMYDVFQVGVIDGVYLSEDYFVCNTLINKGFDIWVDTTISVRHNGNVSF